MKKTARKLFSILGILALTTSCTTTSNSRDNIQQQTGAIKVTNPTTATLIKVDGSSTVYPITQAVVKAYQANTENKSQVQVSISGTGGGFEKFCAGETDISNASRPINQSEMVACKKNNISYMELPIAFDALTIAVNPQNNWAKDITVAELKKIWEPGAEGKITKWNQVRSSWPDRPIKLYGAGDKSGTFDYFTEAIVGKAKASRKDYTASEDDEVLVAGINKDPEALGYFVHINETKGGTKAAAHLLKFDSVHGRWQPQVESVENQVVINGKSLSFTEHSQPAEVPWEDFGVDIVLECSGKFRTPATLDPYFKKGVQKVIVAAPVKEEALNIVMGVNDHLYEPEKHHLLTAASCTTNCLAPVVKVIHEGLGIKHGIITTIHDNTNTQTIVDAPHKDLRRARATSMSLIPTSTGSVTAIGLIYPELNGKLNGLAVRVPLLNASLTDCVFEVVRPTNIGEINGLLKAASEQKPLEGILGYEERPLVSIDYKDDSRSSIIDALSTMVVNETQVKILAWYDNEWGYANRMVELARKVALSLQK